MKTINETGIKIKSSKDNVICDIISEITKRLERGVMYESEMTEEKPENELKCLEQKMIAEWGKAEMLVKLLEKMTGEKFELEYEDCYVYNEDYEAVVFFKSVLREPARLVLIPCDKMAR